MLTGEGDSVIARGVEFDVMDKGEDVGVQVQVQVKAEISVAHARKEVLLCAGAIKSPQVRRSHSYSFVICGR